MKTKKSKPKTKKCCCCGKPIPKDRESSACQPCNQKTADALNKNAPFKLFFGG